MSFLRLLRPLRRQLDQEAADEKAPVVHDPYMPPGSDPQAGGDRELGSYGRSRPRRRPK